MGKRSSSRQQSEDFVDPLASRSVRKGSTSRKRPLRGQEPFAGSPITTKRRQLAPYDNPTGGKKQTQARRADLEEGGILYDGLTPKPVSHADQGHNNASSDHAPQRPAEAQSGSSIIGKKQGQENVAYEQATPRAQGHGTWKKGLSPSKSTFCLRTKGTVRSFGRRGSNVSTYDKPTVYSTARTELTKSSTFGSLRVSIIGSTGRPFARLSPPKAPQATPVHPTTKKDRTSQAEGSFWGWFDDKFGVERIGWAPKKRVEESAASKATEALFPDESLEDEGPIRKPGRLSQDGPKDGGE